MKNKFTNIGMFYMLLAALYFSFMNSCFKFLSNDITINENVFFRGATLSIFVLIMLAIQKIKTKKNKKRKHKKGGYLKLIFRLSLIHISEPTRPPVASRMPSSA